MIVTVRSLLQTGYRRMRINATRGFLTAIGTGLILLASTYAAVPLWSENLTFRLTLVALLNAGGGSVGLLCAWLVWTLLWPWQGLVSRAIFTVFAIGGVVLSMLGAHFLAFVPYHTEWHAPFLTYLWGIQMIFTAATVTAIFLAKGTAYLWPLGWMVPLIVAWQFGQMKVR